VVLSKFKLHATFSGLHTACNTHKEMQSGAAKGSLNQRISIGILEEFLNELSLYSFFLQNSFNPKDTKVGQCRFEQI
jgi:hypothetical protein